MDEENTNQTNTSQTQSAASQKPQKDGGVGPIIGSVIIIILIILAGFYYLSSVTVRAPENGTIEEMSASTLNESDEVPAIEEDLEASDFEDIDRELLEIQAEIDAEYNY